MSDEETIAYSMEEKEGPARETLPVLPTGPLGGGKNSANAGERGEERRAQGAVEAQAGEDILLPLHHHHLQQDTVAPGVQQAAVGSSRLETVNL